MFKTPYEDFVLRQIRVVAEMLARIFRLRTDGKLEHARAELKRAYALLAGPQAPLIRQLDSATAAMLLRHPESISTFAHLLCEEAALLEDATQAGALWLRAMELCLECEAKSPGIPAVHDLIRSLVPLTDPTQLAPGYRAGLNRVVSGGPQTSPDAPPADRHDA
ncbi:MAG: hypothetical protein HZB25_14280 [Candidatus Eisenbacteria bacterium]|nr:hypothetical protein [Candidatus Eisenbacteria bacterium]